MIKRECHSLDLWMCTVHEARNREVIRLINGFWTRDGVNHRAYDDVWVDDDEVEGRRARFHELPRGCFGSGLGYIVSEDIIFSLDSLFDSGLLSISGIFNQQYGPATRTGFQSFSV